MKYAALFISVLLTVAGQILMKLGGTSAGEGKSDLSGLLLSYITSPLVIGGFGISAVAALFFTYSLSKLDYSYVSLVSSLQYVIVILASIFVFKETISSGRWLGCAFILVGTFFVLRS